MNIPVLKESHASYLRKYLKRVLTSNEMLAMRAHVITELMPVIHLLGERYDQCIADDMDPMEAAYAMEAALAILHMWLYEF